jgi:hypothetical protein
LWKNDARDRDEAARRAVRGLVLGVALSLVAWAAVAIAVLWLIR